MSILIVTGVPGVGKSTLCQQIVEKNENIENVNFGRFLTEYIRENETEKGCDKAFVEYLTKRQKNIIIDSHGVEKKQYGLKFTPFTGIENIVGYVLIKAHPRKIIERRMKDAKKRTYERLSEVKAHQNILEIELINYSCITGKPAYVINNDCGVEMCGEKLEQILEEIGMNK